MTMLTQSKWHQDYIHVVPADLALCLHVHNVPHLALYQLHHVLYTHTCISSLCFVSILSAIPLDSITLLQAYLVTDLILSLVFLNVFCLFGLRYFYDNCQVELKMYYEFVIDIFVKLATQTQTRDLD